MSVTDIQEPITSIETAANIAETADTALGGTVKLYQPAKGYRFSVDAVLLARFGAEVGGVEAYDLGCGCGVVGLCLMRIGGASRLTGIELQGEFVRRAERGAEANGLTAATRFHETDIAKIPSHYKRAVADLVLSNPPYRPAGEGRLSSDPSVAMARHEVSATLGDVVRGAHHLLKARGSFCVVYPAKRMDELMESCRQLGLMPHTVRFIHPKLGKEASLLLLRAVKGRVQHLRVEPPLILHPDEGWSGEEGARRGEKYSEEATRLLGPEGVGDAS